METKTPIPTTPVPSLAEILDRHTAICKLGHSENGHVRCVACGHRCLIAPGRRGICKVRFNDTGKLRVPFGYIAGGLACDPIEKKPFFHVYPGSEALTFGMLGCDFHCSYCQNWETSQTLRDAESLAPIVEVTPAQIVKAARRSRARLVVSSYNEPLITSEWAVTVFQSAKEAGFACAFVSNGNLTAEALEFLRPWIVAYKIDLKGFDDKRYRTLGGTLQHVTDGIRLVHQSGLWLEVVTLIVPGFNDSEAELRDAAQFLASVSRDIPWHVTAFHPDYKMTAPRATPVERLVRAVEIGAEAGLRFVYAGNAPGRVGRWEDTVCPQCLEILVERAGYQIRKFQITGDGQCPKCRYKIPGIWPDGGAGEVSLSAAKDLVHRAPRRVAL